MTQTVYAHMNKIKIKKKRMRTKEKLKIESKVKQTNQFHFKLIPYPQGRQARRSK
jgi:hypothetical protein